VAGRLAAPEPRWSVGADVVVIGSGIAGVTAALGLRRPPTDPSRSSPSVAAVASTTASSRSTLEASGGLTVERGREVASTGVDLISVGTLTHSVGALDPGLDLR
jgi:glycine/D-amino acid oxidase-like deaminating enzyme